MVLKAHMQFPTPGQGTYAAYIYLYKKQALATNDLGLRFGFC